MENLSKSKRIRVDVMSSSHFKRNHHLPFFIKREMDLEKQDRFSLPIIDARGSRCLRKNIVEKMQRNIRLNYDRGFRQVQILMLGKIYNYVQ